MKMLRFLLCCCLVSLGSTLVQAQATHTPLRKGDRAYDKAQYKSAEKQYRTALSHNQSDPQAQYNLGDALYQQGNWEDAALHFEDAAKSAKAPAKQADALHNLGNALLQQKKLKEAVQAYEGSLRRRPGDADTKRNLQMAKKMLHEQEQKEREKQQQKQDQQQQQDPSQSPSQNQQGDQPEKQQDQSGQPKQDPQGDNQQQQNQQQQEQEAQQGKLKKEEAKRLLETAIGSEDRKNARKYRAAQQQQGKPKTGKKDW